MNSYLGEGDYINKIDKIKENRKISDFRIWTHKKTILSDKIFPQIAYRSNIVKKLLGILHEQQNEKNTNKSYLYKSQKLKQTSSVKDIFELSTYVKKLLDKAKKNIDYVKNSTNEISKMTSLYLEKKYNENEYKDINNENISQYNDLNNEIKKKQKKIKNFSYISNIYRKQLKDAFFKFNPLTHLENLKILQKVDPLVKKDYDDLKKSIDIEISELTDKHKFRKKFQKLKQINKKNLSCDNIINNSNELNSKINNQNGKLVTIKKPLIYFERLKKADKRKSYFKEEKLEEINILLNSVNSINGQLSNQNIDKYIEDTYDNYLEKKLKNNNINNSYYVLNKSKIDNKLGELYSYKIDKIIKENEKKLQNLLDKDNDTFSKKMINIKDSFNKEFNNNIEKYNINLDIIS